jgi:tetratricopeptide (TPR) repeat protein
MGIVYAAYDPELDRKVALKVLRAELLAELKGQGAQARLLREAQAMARLSHPNVISVHDVGALGTQVFIAMELVEGKTLTRWMKDKSLTSREILETFLQAGKGLAAAHAAGLVHRDFKPENVLIGDDGQIKVLDFGLARAVEDILGDAPTLPPQLVSGGLSTPRQLEANLTRSGVFLGTPAYMAPEQVSGKTIDARADQFSFCVALYEALYGERPFVADSITKLASGIAERKIRPPPSSARVRPWLRGVLLRGLDPDPNRRYPSMDGLLEALRRDPARTRRRWASLAGVFALSLVAAGTVVALRERSLQLCRGGPAKIAGVWDENRRRQVEATFLSTRLPYAQDVWERARSALDKYAAGWVDMYQDACEATHRRGEQSAALLDLRMLCLERRRQELRALVDVFAQADAKVVENAVQAAQAQTPLSTCADTASLTARTKRPESPEARKQIEELHGDLAQIKALTDVGKYKDAIPLAEKAVEAARRTGDGALLAEALLALEAPVRGSKQPKRAEGLLDQAVQAAIAAGDPEALATGLVELAFVVGVDGARPEEGQRWGRYAQAAVTALGAGHDALDAMRLRAIGSIFQMQGNYAEAARFAERGIALRERTLGPDHPEVAKALNNLGSAHHALGAYQQAAEEFHRAATIFESSLGPQHPLVAVALSNEAAARNDLGEVTAALPIHRRALAIREAVLTPDSPYIGESVGNLGSALGKLGRYDEALADLQRSLRIFETSLGPKSPRAADVLAEIARVHLQRGDLQSAITYATRSSAVFAEALGANHATVSLPLLLEGKARLAAGAAAQAISPLERSLAICQAAAVSPQEKADASFTLARALIASGRDRKRAIDLAERAQQLYREQGKGYEDKLGEVEQWLARAGHPNAARAGSR